MSHERPDQTPEQFLRDEVTVGVRRLEDTDQRRLKGLVGVRGPRADLAQHRVGGLHQVLHVDKAAAGQAGDSLFDAEHDG